MTVIRPEWATNVALPHGRGRARRRAGSEQYLAPQPLPWGEAYRPPHVFAVVDVDTISSRVMCGGTITRTPLSSTAGL